MELSEKDFSPEESIGLIRSMIETTRNTISDSSHYFLLWGWATMIACLLQYYLLVIVNHPKHALAWLAMLLAAVVHVFFVIRDKRKVAGVTTYVGEANGYVWMALGFSFFVLNFVFNKVGWQYCFPFYILLYGLGTFITGKLIKFKPLVYGGAACYVLAIFTAYFNYEKQILIAALAILISYIIPGHLLRKQYRSKQN